MYTTSELENGAARCTIAVRFSILLEEEGVMDAIARSTRGRRGLPFVARALTRIWDFVYINMKIPPTWLAGILITYIYIPVQILTN
jgi:hypothetical protein